MDMGYLFGLGAFSESHDRCGVLARALASTARHAVSRFFDRVRTFLRESILAGAMALSGPEPLSPEDLAEVDRQHAGQIAYLDQFERDAGLRTPAEIAEPSGAALTNPMTAAQFVARAELYGNAPWTAAQAVGIGASIRSGAHRIRRVHVGPDVPCEQCQEQERFGWMPVGDARFRPIGSCTCQSGCHCHAELEWPDGTVRWVGGRRVA